MFGRKKSENIEFLTKETTDEIQEEKAETAGAPEIQREMENATRAPNKNGSSGKRMPLKPLNRSSMRISSRAGGI